MRILCLNPQGNFDRDDSYWTEHPDFGGQLVYVKEIAVEMAKLGHDVDIVTRYIDDPIFDKIKGYSDSYRGVDGVRILRVPCGPSNAYLNKELLWEHIEEWVDNIISLYQTEEITIDFATGHYGDGGLACAMLKDKIGIPYSFTGHSLGAQKLDKLLQHNSVEALEKQYHFSKRIAAERTAILYSDVVFVSTDQERDEQYTHPLYSDVSKQASFTVVPPGANIAVFHALSTNEVTTTMKDLEMRMLRDINPSYQNNAYIIAASRLDPKKNHVGLLQAYAQHKELQNRANLIISVRGIENVFDDYSSASKNEQEILSSLLDTIKRNHLEGRVGFLNIRTQHELAETYRMLSMKQGIFTLTALYEPFGLAPIEAMSTGLPAVVTQYGGPSDVLKDQDGTYGVLIDIHSPSEIAEGLLTCLDHYDFYKQQGMKRVYSSYTWTISAEKYIKAMNQQFKPAKQVVIPPYFYTKSASDLQALKIKK